MKKSHAKDQVVSCFPLAKQLLKIMKLTIVLLITALTVHAKAVSQDIKVSLSLENVKLTRFFKVIENQTGYRFVYSNDILNKSSRVTVNAKERPVSQLLKEVLEKESLKCRFMDDAGIIVVSKRTEKEEGDFYLNDFADQGLIEVKGKITDSTGKPLAKVSVSVNKNNAVISNELGEYTIKVDGNAKLTFSYVGYANQVIAVNNRTVINVVLKIAASSLEDVVVIGTQGISRKKNVSAVSTVTAKEIENMPAPSVDQLLQGRVPGLNVQISSGEPGVAPTMVIRGNTKVNFKIDNPNVAQAQALSSPLYVIDGIPIDPQDIANTIDNTGTNYLAGLNINDIESVDIQKDAIATAAWGSRGANGVLYIKTKRGKSLKPEFRINAYGGVVTQNKLLPTYIGAEERLQKLKILSQYPAKNGAGAAQAIPNILTDYNNPYFNNTTDWQNLFYQNGAIENTELTISQGTETFDYRFSGNFYNEKGIIKQFGLTRYSLRGNFNFKISPKLNAQLIVSASSTNRKRGAKLNNSDDNTPVSGANQPASFFGLNAFDSAQYTGIGSLVRNKNINNFYSGNFTLNYDIFKRLKYTFQGSISSTSSNNDYFQPSNLAYIGNQNFNGATYEITSSYAQSNHGTYNSYFISNTLAYNASIKTKANHSHNFVLSASQQFTRNQINSINVNGQNLPNNTVQVVTNVPQSFLRGSSDYQADALFSLMSQFQYSFDTKYILYASFRGDASSRFGANNKWGYFPAVGTGWVITDEKFMKPLTQKGVINYLKFRVSYGMSGDQPTTVYAPYNSYVNNVNGSYNGTSTLTPDLNNGLTQGNLTWGNTSQKDLGLDAFFFNNRLGITADIYDKTTKNEPYTFNLPFYVGYNTVTANASDLWINNRGLDLSITTRNFAPDKKLQWNMQLTLSFVKNAVAKLPNNNRTIIVTDYAYQYRIFQVGLPLYQMYQIIYAGVYNKQSEIPFDPITGKSITYYKGNHTVVPGDPIWVDINKSGDVWRDGPGGSSGDLTTTGDPNPKFTGGWINDFTYKNFSLSIASSFTYKRTIINNFLAAQIGAMENGLNSFATSRLPDLSKLDYWTPEKATNPNYKANFPSINPFIGNYYYQWGQPTTMYNRDGSYFKIQNIAFSYRLGNSITKKFKINTAKIYFMLDNILTISNSGVPNPEMVDQVGNYNGGMYPLPKKGTIGLDIQF